MSGHGNRYISGLRWSLGQQFFLESGFLDVLPLVPYFEPKPPATFYLTNEIAAEYAKDFKFLDTIRMPGLTQKANDVRTYVNEMDSLAIDSSLEEDDPDDFVDGKYVRESTSDKRYAMLNNEAVCHFATNTGKMKLWAQCRMGIKYTDPTMVGVLVDATLYKFMTGRFFLHQSVTGSHGLFTTTDYKYYYITIEDGIVYARYCTHDKKVSSLVKLLISGTHPTEDRELTDEELYKIESYVLAYTTLDFFTSTEGIYAPYALNASPFSVSGTPLAYGWKFNWKGDKLSIVTLVNEDNPSPHNISRLYTITITEDLRNDIQAPISASIQLVEEVLCTPRPGVDNAWVPNPLFYPLMSYYYFFYCDQTLTHSTFIYDTEAPIYCWYGSTSRLSNPYYNGEDEELIIVRLNLVDEPPPAGTTVPVFCGPTSTSGTVKAVSGAWVVEKGGFYTDPYDSLPQDLRGTVESVTDYMWNVSEGTPVRQSETPAQAGISNPCSINRPTNPDPGDPYYVAFDRYPVVGTAYEHVWTGQKLYESTIIIPWDSAESVYFAKMTGTRKAIRDERDYVLQGTWNSVPISGYCVNQPQYYELGIIIFSLIIYWWSPPGGYVINESGEFYDVNLLHSLYFKNGSIELLNEDLSWGTRVIKRYEGGDEIPVEESTTVTTIPGHVSAYDDVYDPIICGPEAYPFLNSSYVNLESILNVGVYKNAEPYFGSDEETLVDDNNLPSDGADFNSMFIGWS